MGSFRTQTSQQTFLGRASFQSEFGAKLDLRHNNGEIISLGWAVLIIRNSATNLSIFLYYNFLFGSEYSLTMAKYYQIFNLSKTSNNMRITLCQYCGRGNFTSGKQFLEHLLKHKKLQFNCNQCAKILTTPKSLRDHKRDVHGEGFICKWCNKKFAKKNGLNRHMQSTSKECEECKM